jgi:hypothetical protein
MIEQDVGERRRVVSGYRSVLRSLEHAAEAHEKVTVGSRRRVLLAPSR